MAVPRVGERAPELSIPDETGKAWKLKDLKGKKVVLYFYPRDETPGCTVEACSFRDNLREIEKTGAVVLGVSPDSVESHAKFKQKHSLNFPLLADTSHRVCEAYGVWVEKNTFGVKTWGVARTTFIIDGRGKIARVFEKVNPLGHEREVLEALKGA